ncbi:hypothetical protein [Candidatus Hydrogenosomobacter endosymbioticus]|uniref:Uncharacterized protein n=1 Tax=Candidatus Hydrogenosomobacter endosymbioticus TaxID=2558174 RepID=A0ABM7V960_9PROT|nr:hypothetical protein [Candidatus Hydrogenosomobacter endosymbioticus]BDB96330.1 hypothetical protein HYD_4630 [Candidatus Hydrogenosomobacter endosymbioticus]
MKKISIIYLAALSAATLCSYDASAGPILSKAKDGISFVFDNKKTVIPVVGVVGLFVINNKFKIFNNLKIHFISGNNNDDHSMRIKGDNNIISCNLPGIFKSHGNYNNAPAQEAAIDLTLRRLGDLLKKESINEEKNCPAIIKKSNSKDNEEHKGDEQQLKD